MQYRELRHRLEIKIYRIHYENVSGAPSTSHAPLLPHVRSRWMRNRWARWRWKNRYWLLCMEPPQQILKCIFSHARLLPKLICFPTDQMEAPSRSYLQLKTKSICSQLAAERNCCCCDARIRARGDRQKLGLELGGGAAVASACWTSNGDWRRSTRRAREGGTSHLGGWEAGREACSRGIHPTVVGRLAGMKRRGILGQWLSVLEYWS